MVRAISTGFNKMFCPDARRTKELEMLFAMTTTKTTKTLH
jgi:hypothetical protein